MDYGGAAMAEERFLEDVRLVHVSLTLNPVDLVKFDQIVGKKKRSEAVRDMIRDYIEDNAPANNKEEKCGGLSI